MKSESMKGLNKVRWISTDADSRKSRIVTCVWMLLLIAIIVWLNLPWTPVFRTLDSDSGVYAYIGSAISHGQVLYRDVWEQKPPVGLYLNALAITLFGQNPWSIWWLNTIWIILAAETFFLVAKKMFRTIAGIISSAIFAVAVMIPGIFQGGNLMEIYGLMPQVLAIGVTYVFFRTRQNRWIVAAGAIACISFLTKQTTISLSFASLFAIGVFSLLEREWRSLALRVFCFASGLIVPFIITVMYWEFMDALNKYLAGILFYSLSYVNVGAPFLWSIKHTFLDIFPGMLVSKLYYIATAAIVIYILDNLNWVRQQIRPGRIKDSPPSARIDPTEATMFAVFLALPMEVVFTSLGGRNLGHYFISLIPATVTVIGYVFGKAFLFLRTSQKNLLTLRTWSGIASILLGLLSLYWFAIALSGELPTKTQFASIQSIFSGEYEINEIPRYILANTNQDDPVLVWHIALYNNFITGRRPPQRVIFPGEIFIPSGGKKSGLAEFIDEIEENPPKLIIVQKESSIGLPFVNVPVDQMCPKGACLPEMASVMTSPETISELTKFREFFLANYVFDKQIYDWLMYKRIE